MSLFGTGRREGFLAALLLVVLAIVQHAPGLFFGHTRAPIDLSAASSEQLACEASTNQAILVPAMRQAGSIARDGALPLWNPFARLGEPIGATGAPILYPPYWLLTSGLGGLALELLLCLHSALACVLAYRMLRTLSASRFSAFVAGGAYGLGWAMTVALDRLPEAAAAAWLPLAVEATWRCLFEHRRARSATLLGASLGVMFFTGGTATATFGLLLVLAALATGLLAINRADRFRAMRAVGTGTVMCMLLTAPLWLSAIEHRGLLLGPRGPETPGLPATTLTSVFAPGLFGEMRTADSALDLADGGVDHIAFALYPGALTLFVGLLGLLRPKRTRQSLFWIAIAGLSLVLATRGDVGDTLRRCLVFLPNRPGAELALFQIAVCVLCALALESFFDAPRARRIALPLAAGAVLTLTTFALVTFVLAPSLGRELASLMLQVDPAALTTQRMHEVLLAVLAPTLTGTGIAIAFLVWRRLGILRFKTTIACMALGEAVLLALLAVPRGRDDARPLDLALTAAEGRVMRAGMDPRGSANDLAARSGSRAIDTTGNAILARTRRLLDELEPGMVRLDGHARVAGLRVPALLCESFRQALALGTVVGDDAPPGFQAMLAAPGGETSNRTMLHTADRPTPRARIAFQPLVAHSTEEAADLMTSTLRRAPDAVVLEGALGDFTPNRPATPTPIEWLRDGANEVALRVTMGDGRGYLVLSDALAPGWHCTVDGERAIIHPADVATRAVALREGSHEVVFRYLPLSLRIGIPLGVFGLILALGALAWDLRRR
ncbi:MAG: hypothetical protein U1F36_06750 [Planctomycetota bacterium]